LATLSAEDIVPLCWTFTVWSQYWRTEANGRPEVPWVWQWWEWAMKAMKMKMKIKWVRL